MKYTKEKELNCAILPESVKGANKYEREFRLDVVKRTKKSLSKEDLPSRVSMEENEHNI